MPPSIRFNTQFMRSGVHRWETRTWPHRWVVANTDVGWDTCDLCDRVYRIWITDNTVWRMLPRRMLPMRLCISCFRRAVADEQI